MFAPSFVMISKPVSMLTMFIVKIPMSIFGDQGVESHWAFHAQMVRMIKSKVCLTL